MKEQASDYIASEGVLTRGLQANLARLRAYLHRAAEEEMARRAPYMRRASYRYGMVAIYGLNVVANLVLALRHRPDGFPSWLHVAMAIGWFMPLAAHVSASFTLPQKVNYFLRLYVVVIFSMLLLVPLGWLVCRLAS